MEVTMFSGRSVDPPHVIGNARQLVTAAFFKPMIVLFTGFPKR
jgi:hypothetical protein